MEEIYIQNLCHLQILRAFLNRSCFQISANFTNTIIVRPYQSKCLKQHAYCIVSCFSYQNFLTSKNDIFAHLLSSFSDQKSRWPTEFLKNGRKEVDSDGDLTYIFFFICHILTTCTFSKFMLISNNRTLKQIKKTL